GVSRYFSFSDQVVYPSGRADDYLGFFLELLKLSGEAGVADNKGGTHVKAGIFSQQTRLPVYLHGKLVGGGEYYCLSGTQSRVCFHKHRKKVGKRFARTRFRSDDGVFSGQYDRYGGLLHLRGGGYALIFQGG